MTTGRPLRIAHVGTERSWRGGEQQMLYLMRGLQARGHANVGVVHADGEMLKRLTAASLPFLPVRPWGEWDVFAARRLARRLKEERVDLLHAHTGHAVSLAVLAGAFAGLPVVASRRVDYPIGSHFFSRWKYRRPARWLAISQKVRDVLLAGGLDPARVALVPSGVDFDRYHGIEPVSRQALGVSPEAVLIGQVAALSPQKDQATFLRALAQMTDAPDWAAIIVGDGPDRTAVENLARDLRLEGRVRFLGFQEKALAYLAAFDLFCLSSRDEGLGTSILDAMALRVPVVATAAGGIPELVEDGRTGYLVPVQNPGALASALKRAMSDRPSNKALTSAAYEKARGYDIGQTVTLTERVYREVLG